MQKNKNLFLTFSGVFICVLFFALIRFFQNQLFYDPFIIFFKTDYKNTSLPDYESLKLFFSYSLRFLFNSLISIVLIFIIFREKEVVKICTILFFAIYLILLLASIFTLNLDSENYMLWFYVRRFIIQPLFVMLFIPGIYYQKKMVSK